MADKPTTNAIEGDYAGDVSAADAWQALQADPQALLVDVRTKVEWQLIGQPDLSSLEKEPVYLQWVTMDGINKNFVDELQQALVDRAAQPDTPVYFMCQSGGRSKMSAIQCTELGFNRCFNVADGFEGDLDEHSHRNSVNGWKYSGLLWTQS